MSFNGIEEDDSGYGLADIPANTGLSVQRPPGGPPPEIIYPTRINEMVQPDILNVLHALRNMDPLKMEQVTWEMIQVLGGVEQLKLLADSSAILHGCTLTDAAFNVWSKGLITDPMSFREEKAKKLFFGFYRKALTMFNGGSGAGKSTNLLLILWHLAAAADNEAARELWGVPIGIHENKDGSFGEKILYVDPENRGDVRPERLKQIEEATGIPFPTGRLVFHNASGMNLMSPTVMQHLGDILIEGGFTGCVLDPIGFLYQVANENDNAEAQRQMRAISDMIDRTGCWVAAVHHTGKTEEAGSRGAAAREDFSYVVLELRLAGEDADADDEYIPGVERVREDYVRLKKKKDRFDGAKTSIYLRMQDNLFVRVPRKEFVKAKENNGSGMSSSDQSAILIRGLFDTAQYHDAVLSRTQICEIIKLKVGAKAPGQNKIDELLKELVAKEFLRPSKIGRMLAYSRSDVKPDDVMPAGGEGGAADEDEDEDTDLEGTGVVDD